jgi:hypothetical protein
MRFGVNSGRPFYVLYKRSTTPTSVPGVFSKPKIVTGRFFFLVQRSDVSRRLINQGPFKNTKTTTKPTLGLIFALKGLLKKCMFGDLEPAQKLIPS